MIVPGIAGMAVMSTTFIALALNMVFLREQGVLKRIRGTPLPSTAYLGGVAGNAVTNTVLQVGDHRGRRQAAVRRSAGRATWSSSCVFVVAGVVLLRRAGRRALARDPQLRLGARLRQRDLPARRSSSPASSTTPRTRRTFLRDIAEALPLKHLIDGLSGAMVRGNGIGDHWTAVAVIAVWAAIGIFFAIRGFSWESRSA